MLSAWAEIQTHAFNLDPEYFEKLNPWQEASTQPNKTVFSPFAFPFPFFPSSLSFPFPSLYSKLKHQVLER